MKISIITVVYNKKDTIQDAINSVLSQNYDNLEYIIVDGASTDGTVEVINEALRIHSKKNIKFIGEKDNGIYDAMNKGIRTAGGYVIGILNSDDFFIKEDIISVVVNEFKTKGVDSIFALKSRRTFTKNY